jgi:hypothetical protein
MANIQRRILCCCADERNSISPNGVENYILLWTRDSVYLVTKHDGCLPTLVYILCSRRDDALIFCRRRSQAADLVEPSSHHRRDDPGNCSFAASWRPPQNQIRKVILLNQPSECTIWPDQGILTDDIIEAPRPGMLS